ncbi:MAG TPA: proteasome assembly chaperone family protein [Methanocella sp.]|nr:proteasome assembly chaperone family protein [Methanocella sp.]
MVDKAEEPFVQVIADQLESKNPIIMSGFPGMGIVGNIVTQYFIDQLDMKLCGRVESRLFPPIAILYEGLVKGPVRIYEKPEKGLIIVFSDIPIDPIISREVGTAIVKWAKTLNPREMISLAGLATTGEGHKVFGAATSREILEEIKGKVDVFEMGTITGVPGVIMNECLNQGINSVCILGETRGPNPDPRAAIEVVKAMNHIYEFDIDIKAMEAQATEIEQVLHKLSEQIGEAEAKSGQRDIPMYG